jgi:hypothetical protein
MIHITFTTHSAKFYVTLECAGFPSYHTFYFLIDRGTTVVIPSQRDINVCPVKKIEGISIGKGVLFWPTFLSL